MSVFPEPDFPTQFRALGLVKGSYSPTEEFKGVLILENGMEVNATLNKYLKTRISNRPSWLENAKGVVHCWKIYPRTDPTGKLSNVQLKSSHTVESAHWEVGNRVVARGLIAEEIEAENNSSSIKVKIHPNPEGRRRNKKPFTIVITGDSLPEAKAGEFWEVVADVVDGQLIYQSGECIEKDYDPNITYIPRRKKPKDQSGDSIEPNSAEKAKGDANALDSNSEPQSTSNKSTQQSTETLVSKSKSNVTQTGEKTQTPVATANKDNSQPASSDIIMIPGRAPELTVKFSTRPELPETGKKVTLQINSDNGLSVRATLNRKTLKKQVDKMDSFDEWVGALSGQMSGIADDGVIELEGAGLQVFEKKKKPVESEKQESDKSVTEKKEESITPSKN